MQNEASLIIYFLLFFQFCNSLLFAVLDLMQEKTYSLKNPLGLKFWLPYINNHVLQNNLKYLRGAEEVKFFLLSIMLASFFYPFDTSRYPSVLDRIQSWQNGGRGGVARGVQAPGLWSIWYKENFSHFQNLLKDKMNTYLRQNLPFGTDGVLDTPLTPFPLSDPSLSSPLQLVL